MRQNNTCDTAIRPGRLLDGTHKRSSKHTGEHNHTHFTGIQFTVTRRRRTGTPHTLRTDTNTESTNVPELQQANHHETPHHAVDSATQRIHREQIRHTRKRIHKLLQQMAQRATYATMLIRRNRTIHGLVNKTVPKARTTLLQRNMAWEGHNHRRIPDRDTQQDTTHTYDTTTDQTAQVQPTTLRRDQHRTAAYTNINAYYAGSADNNHANDAACHYHNDNSKRQGNTRTQQRAHQQMASSIQANKRMTARQRNSREQRNPSPMATAPPMTQRPALPMPTSSTRPRSDEVTEGSTSKQQKTTAGAPVKERPHDRRTTATQKCDNSHHTGWQTRRDNIK